MSTKYPILLVHGMGIRDNKYLNSWGRIPEALTAEGHAVFHGGQDAVGNVDSNAQMLKARVMEILAETGCEKVNIIAHSKGGLDSRRMISRLDMGDRVASLTTIATPHNGSKTVDTLLKFPDPLVRFGCKFVDMGMRLVGDVDPNTYEVIWGFTTEQAERFNAETPDDPRVYYQSYAFVMKDIFSDILMTVPHLVVKYFEGENDGLLPPSAVRWTNFRGEVTGTAKRGASHMDAIDLRRQRMKLDAGEQPTNITKFYIDLAGELAEMGF